MGKNKPAEATQTAATVRQRAESIVRAAATDVTSMSTEETQRLVYELQVHQVELELQNEQLRDAQFDLASSRDRLADLYDFAPIGYMTLAGAGIVIDANLTAASMLGTERESLKNTSFSEFVAPASQDAAYLYWQQVYSYQGKQIAELELQRANGQLLNVRLESVAFDSPDHAGPQCRAALIDVTDLHEARQKLISFSENLETRVNEQVEEIKLLANALANLSEGVLITSDGDDWDSSRVVFANQSMCSFIGKNLEEIRNKMASGLWGEKFDPVALGKLTAQISSARLFQGELSYSQKDGSRGEVELTISPLEGADRERFYFVAVQRDITERKRYEVALRDRKERLQAIQDAALDAIITIDQKGVVLDCNPAVARIFGYTTTQLMGQNISLLMPEPHRSAHDSYMRRYIETQEPHIIGRTRKLRGLHRDGHSFPITLSVSEVDHLGLYTGIISDTSEVNQLQQDVLRAAGEVQWRIGQALHDGPQQALAGLGLVARGLAIDLAREGSAYAKEASELGDKLNQANLSIRSLGRGLIPLQVGSSGLLAALENLARQISMEYELECDCHVPEPVNIDDNFVANQLYLIAQEASFNAAKHAAADHIDIVLESQGQTISLRVIDNGTGIARSDDERSGLGMRIMPYRAETIGGSLNISDAAGGGTVVECKFAYDSRAPNK